MPVWLQQLLTLAIPILVGVLTVPLVNAFKSASTWLNNQPDAVKQLLVLLITYGANEITKLTGVILPTSLGGYDSVAVGTLISTGLAYLLHLASSVSTVKAIQTKVIVNSQATKPAISPNIPTGK